MILPTRPRWTPSGFTMIKVLSLFADMALDIIENIDKIQPIIQIVQRGMENGIKKVAKCKMDERKIIEYRTIEHEKKEMMFDKVS